MQMYHLMKEHRERVLSLSQNEFAIAWPAGFKCLEILGRGSETINTFYEWLMLLTASRMISGVTTHWYNQRVVYCGTDLPSTYHQHNGECLFHRRDISSSIPNDDKLQAQQKLLGKFSYLVGPRQIVNEGCNQGLTPSYATHNQFAAILTNLQPEGGHIVAGVQGFWFLQLEPWILTAMNNHH